MEGQKFEMSMEVVRDISTENVHAAAYLACRQLGRAIAGNVKLDDELDSVLQLSKTEEGRRFLGLAAVVIRMVGPESGELAVHELFKQEKELMDNFHLPVNGMVRDFLRVIQRKLKMEPKNSGSEKLSNESKEDSGIKKLSDALQTCSQDKDGFILLQIPKLRGDIEFNLGSKTFKIKLV